MVRSGELSARELVQASLGASTSSSRRSTPSPTSPPSRRWPQAAEIEPGDPRPFAGVPIAIKDNRPVAGMPLTMCSDLFGDFVADHDAFLVRRLRDAGFVIVGKTTLPEMGILPTTESRRFGPTANPWALDRTPGGSSGGSAAAVAAGMVPIAHGNDGGGSIRIPAACCGLVGLKAAARTRLAGTRRRPQLPRHRRRPHPHRRRHRRRCSTSSPATSSATPPGRRRPRGRLRRLAERGAGPACGSRSRSTPPLDECRARSRAASAAVARRRGAAGVAGPRASRSSTPPWSEPGSAARVHPRFGPRWR